MLPKLASGKPLLKLFLGLLITEPIIAPTVMSLLQSRLVTFFVAEHNSLGVIFDICPLPAADEAPFSKLTDLQGETRQDRTPTINLVCRYDCKFKRRPN